MLMYICKYYICKYSVKVYFVLILHYCLQIIFYHHQFVIMIEIIWTYLSMFLCNVNLLGSFLFRTYKRHYQVFNIWFSKS